MYYSIIHLQWGKKTYMIHSLLADRTDETLIVLNAEYAFACIINISRDVLREYMYMVLPVSLISFFFSQTQLYTTNMRVSLFSLICATL